MGSWMNSDGLYLEYGTTKTSAETAGEYKTYGLLREVELTIDLTTLTSSPVIQSNTEIFPSGTKIQEVVVFASTAATSSGSGTLDIGLQKLDRSTQIDYDGVVAALALTSIDSTGEQTTLTKGVTSAGALVGTTVGSDPGYLTANYNTGAFQTGVVRVRVRYYVNTTITQ